MPEDDRPTFRPSEDDEGAEMNAARVCFFCGRETNPADRPVVVYMALIDEYPDGELDWTMGWTCHRTCAKAARHPDAPWSFPSMNSD